MHFVQEASSISDFVNRVTAIPKGASQDKKGDTERWHHAEHAQTDPEGRPTPARFFKEDKQRPARSHEEVQHGQVKDPIISEQLPEMGSVQANRSMDFPEQPPAKTEKQKHNHPRGAGVGAQRS